MSFVKSLGTINQAVQPLFTPYKIRSVLIHHLKPQNAIIHLNILTLVRNAPTPLHASVPHAGPFLNVLTSCLSSPPKRYRCNKFDTYIFACTNGIRKCFNAEKKNALKVFWDSANILINQGDNNALRYYLTRIWIFNTWPKSCFTICSRRSRVVSIFISYYPYEWLDCYLVVLDY